MPSTAGRPIGWVCRTRCRSCRRLSYSRPLLPVAGVAVMLVNPPGFDAVANNAGSAHVFYADKVDAWKNDGLCHSTSGADVSLLGGTAFGSCRLERVGLGKTSTRTARSTCSSALLPLIFLGACDVGYNVRAPDLTDSRPTDSGGEDSGGADTGGCPAVVDPTVSGASLQLEPDGVEVYEARELATAVRPATVAGEARVWAQSGATGCLRWGEAIERCGLYLLDGTDWDSALLPQPVTPLLPLDESGEFSIPLVGVTVLGGPMAEGLIFLQEDADSGTWAWRVFPQAPEVPTSVSGAPLTVADVTSDVPPVEADVESDTWSDADVTWSPSLDADELGEGTTSSFVDHRAGVERVRDVTGDGRDDILVRSQPGPDSMRDQLVSYLLSDATAGAFSIDQELALAAPVGQASPRGLLGYAGADDVDGDGNTDLLLHPFAESGPDWYGLLFLGPLGPERVARTELHAEVAEEEDQARLGVVGDLDGDGRSEWIFVDHAAESQPARAWLVNGCP